MVSKMVVGRAEKIGFIAACFALEGGGVGNNTRNAGAHRPEKAADYAD
ncbi:hypothetical protein ACFPOB_19545 [Bosea eneae]|uniref:Uncharacterized protein n=1 Tax=Bosea eneae TaxID=151454 RepID=A0ABW0IUI6_9HYPH